MKAQQFGPALDGAIAAHTGSVDGMRLRLSSRRLRRALAGLAALVVLGVATIVAAQLLKQAPFPAAATRATVPVGVERFHALKEQQAEERAFGVESHVFDATPATSERYNALKERQIAERLDAATANTTPAVSTTPKERASFAEIKERQAAESMDRAMAAPPSTGHTRYQALKERQAEARLDEATKATTSTPNQQ